MCHGFFLAIFCALLSCPAFGESQCGTARVQSNFLQNCQMAGMQYFDSFGAKADMEKINSVCRCVTNHFVVESNPGLDKVKCETPVRWISNFLKRDDSKAACGYFQ